MKVSVVKSKDNVSEKKKMNKRQRKIQKRIQLVSKSSKIEKKKERIKLHFTKFKPKNKNIIVDPNDDLTKPPIGENGKLKKKYNKSKKSKVKDPKVPAPKSILKKSKEASDISNKIEVSGKDQLESVPKPIKPKKKKKISKDKLKETSKDLDKAETKSSKESNTDTSKSNESTDSIKPSEDEDKSISSPEKVKKGKKRKIKITNNWDKLKEGIHEETVKLLPPPFKFIRTLKTGIDHLDKKDSNSGKEEIWFDGVDPILLETAEKDTPEISNGDIDSKLVTDSTDNSITKAVGLDCEMVGVGPNASESALARVSIVNQFGNVLYDKYVKPQEKVVDYRTQFSGIRPSDLVDGMPFATVQKEVSEIVKGRLLVGHDLIHDLRCLFLSHPKNMRRDTSKYKPFRTLNGGVKPSLKKLAARLLSIDIQLGEHDSVIDAKAAMRMYTLNKKEWESLIKQNKGGYKKGVKPSKTNDEDDESE